MSQSTGQEDEGHGIPQGMTMQEYVLGDVAVNLFADLREDEVFVIPSGALSAYYFNARDDIYMLEGLGPEGTDLAGVMIEDYFEGFNRALELAQGEEGSSDPLPPVAEAKAEVLREARIQRSMRFN